MMADKTFMTDWRSVEQDESCGMKYWFSHLEGGNGIAKKENVIPDILMDQTHEDLRVIAQAEDITPRAIQAAIDDILAGLTEDDKEDYAKMEVLTRRLGWMAGFALFMEPMIRQNYETIDIDDQIILDRNPLWVITHPDRVLKSRTSGDVIYREYASMDNGVVVRKPWLAQWQTNMRLHVGMLAAGETIKSPISYAQMIGFATGYVSLQDGRMVHPYVYGYRNNQTHVWSAEYRSSNEPNSVGEWVVTPVWKYPGGIVQWVTICGRDVANRMFATSPAIDLDNKRVDEWVMARLARERSIEIMKDHSYKNLNLRNIHFAKRNAECRPMMGPVCPFLNACWGQKTHAEIMKGGEFVPNQMQQIEVVVGEVVA